MNIPIESIKRISAKRYIEQDLMTIQWILGRFCNYSCSYCWPSSHSKKYDFRAVEEMMLVIDSVKKQARSAGINSFSLVLAGGEPTIHPDFFKFIQHFSSDKLDQYTHLSLVTNLSRHMKWWKEFCELAGMFSFINLSASWHKEFAKKDEFIEKVLFIDQHSKILPIVNIVMVPDFWGEQYNTALEFFNAGLNVNIKPMTIKGNGTTRMADYSNDQLKFLQTADLYYRNRKKDYPPPKNGRHAKGAIELEDFDGNLYSLNSASKLMPMGLTDYRGWSCSAGKNLIKIIEPGGIVRRGNDCKDQILGTIESGFEIYKENKPCITPVCSCFTDLALPKHRAHKSNP